MDQNLKPLDQWAEAGINCIPGSDGPLGKNQEKIYQTADEIGYPVIVKAAAGGGGKGVRIAHTKANLQHAIDLTRAEAKAAFGDDLIYMEKFLGEGYPLDLLVGGKI